MTKRKTNADLQREVEQLREQLSSARQMPEILTFTVAVTIDGRVVGATPSFSLQSPQHVVVVKRALMGIIGQLDQLWEAAVAARQIAKEATAPPEEEQVDAEPIDESGV